ncbi:cyclic nucleotide-binding domain-containing protein [Desulfococcus sp.]|uniref:cyclic nucleotide-binding domain-containing protein n=1 Tax=Desulfococcus sp. TaxID=2025834 RepID=UPI003592FE31
MNDLTLENQRIETFVRQGRKAEAVELIFNLIVENAKAKNFPAAYALREKLFEVDAMALVEIIRSAEIIEDEKGGAIEKRHLEIWRKLYSTLMPEEANALYFRLKPAVYDAGAAVFRQGHKNRHLHFIDQGELNLVCREGSTEKLIRSMGAGTLAGGDTFFNVSVCTTSLLSQSRSSLKTLHHDDFTDLRRTMPSLAVKLEDYFSKTTKDHELLKEQDINRRHHLRVRIGGVIQFFILNAEGAPIADAFKGSLSDISIGGISFFIRITNPKLPQMLLGRKIRVEFSIPAKPSGIDVAETGVVIGVIDHLFNSYSVHLRFARELPESLIEAATSPS